ncbi:XXYS1_4_G0056080.mRNA.1.CDS.1 [Saccharomyces cerevisiae]|nr:EM14S01-3B_G0053400.mRNA.1.CDS.1 [Saccharomyces cerevisiae]CAD6621062.1 XXYS1_4_G0056080.mRNA.1.CDS.1 [Saccharomyces cerevisiae]CAI4397854.1 AMH_1a_G0027300.mRNA.1.CDS.1 [Saccharomyces cerevisiae]CAI4407980.1 CEI_1a_G0027240.mRNA.1.CDS.1 [Saccharomyces cerevisiae]CAI6610164.1 AMH_1a_G0027300.mRNA.1.CDS.1 [Saccharomyces cerevisiae]
MTFSLRRKISFFCQALHKLFLFLPLLLNRSVIHVVFLTVVLGHLIRWDSVIRCNNTDTTHSAVSSRTKLLLPIGGVINNWKRRAWNGFSIQWIWKYSFVY